MWHPRTFVVIGMVAMTSLSALAAKPVASAASAAMAKTAANDTNTEFAGGYALANLRWSARFNLAPADALELLVRVDNVFDRVYAGSVIVNDGNSRFFETGSPRAGLLSARWLHRW